MIMLYDLLVLDDVLCIHEPHGLQRPKVDLLPRPNLRLSLNVMCYR
jgi:hypothetical protein